MAKDEPRAMRIWILEPKCQCGESMSKLSGFQLTETKQLIFIGTCNNNCEIGATAVDIEKAIVELKKKDPNKLKEVSEINMEDGEDYFGSESESEKKPN